MTYDDLKLDDGQILDVLDIARTHGALAMIHAENADCIEWLTKRLEAAGRTRAALACARPAHAGGARSGAPRRSRCPNWSTSPFSSCTYRAAKRSSRSAGRGTRAVRVCRACAVSVPHRGRPGHRRPSAGRALRLQPAAARQGQPGNHLGRPGRRTVHRVLVRPRALRFDEPQGEAPAARRCPSATSPTASRAWRLPLLYSRACWAAASLAEVRRAHPTNPAKAYGLHPRKGTIAVGSDADLVVWDQREVKLSNGQLHHAVDYTPYEGMRLKAWPA